MTSTIHPRANRRITPAMLLVALLATTCLPAISATLPATAKPTETATPLTTSPLAAPLNPEAILTAQPTAAIASPDTAPLAAQLEILQQMVEREQASEQAAAISPVKTLLQRAFSLLGTPYRFGGSSPETGFDCSGLVGYVFRTIGIDLPRVSRAIAGEGTKITRDALKEGDVVLFGNSGRIDHVGIYVGDGSFLHAPSKGRNVTVSKMDTGHWAQRFMGARRVVANVAHNTP